MRPAIQLLENLMIDSMSFSDNSDITCKIEFISKYEFQIKKFI